MDDFRALFGEGTQSGTREVGRLSGGVGNGVPARRGAIEPDKEGKGMTQLSLWERLLPPGSPAGVTQMSGVFEDFSRRRYPGFNYAPGLARTARLPLTRDVNKINRRSDGYDAKRTPQSSAH